MKNVFYDPMHLVNLSKNDLKMLYKQQIFYRDDWRHHGYRYQSVVDVFVKKKLHAGSKWHDSEE